MNISLPLPPPRNALTLAGWLAAFWPLSVVVGGAGGDVIGTLIALLFLVHSFLHKEWGWLKQRWVQVAFLLWIYTLLRSLWADDVGEALGRAVSWVRFPLMAASLAYGVLPQENVARILWQSLLAVLIFLIADGLLQYATNYDVLGRPLFNIGGDVLRLTGPFHDPRLGIVLVALAFPVILPLLGGRQWWAGIILSLLFLFVVFASGERMALLLTLVGFIIAFVLWRGALYARAGALALVIIVLTASMITDPARMQRQYHSTIDSITHFNETAYGKIWQSAFAIIKDRPIFGVGPRQFRTVCKDARYGSIDPDILPVRCNLHPHNIYIEWLVETGIVGLSLFIIMLGSIFLLLWRGLKTRCDDALYLGLFINFILRFWPVAGTTSFFAGWMAAPVWFLTGWALYQAQKPVSDSV